MEFGYEGTEELKQDYVFNDGAKFNILIDTVTGEWRSNDTGIHKWNTKK